MNEYLLGLLAILFGGFLYQRNKANTAEARNDNIETKESLNVIDKDIAKNDGSIAAEDEKQSDLRKELDHVTSETNLTVIANIIDSLTKKPK